MNSKFYERAGIVGVIDPDAYTVNTYTSNWIDMGHWRQIAGIVMAGDLGSSATIDAKFEQATTSGGTPKDISPARAIAQLTQAGTDDNKQAVLQLRHDELDLDNGYRWVRLSVAVGTATSDVGAIVLGIDPMTTPNTSYDISTVDEVAG